MIRATRSDKELIVGILTNSFADNKSVNYIIQQDSKRIERIKSLMEYSFEVCLMFGEVFISADKKGCALILFPDKKKTTVNSLLLDLKLLLKSTGLQNAIKAMKREEAIQKLHPDGLLYYLWFIGVDNSEQNKGIGSALLQEVITQATLQKRLVILETSTEKNIPWYEKHGFKMYNKLNLGYNLYFLKNINN